MTRFVLFLLGTALLSIVPEVRGAEPFKPYLNCLKSLRVCSKGKSVSISSDSPSEVVLLIGTRGGKDGFYAYAEEDAYFYAFPPRPKRPDKPYVAPPPTFWNLYGFVTKLLNPSPPAVDNYFYFKLEPGIHDLVYLSFHWLETPDSNSVGLSSFSKTTMPSTKVVYLPGVGGECHADVESRTVISEETVARISSVYATWISAPRPPKGDVLEEYNLPGREMRITYGLEECEKSLDSCMDSDDLKRAALAEKAKFKG